MERLGLSARGMHRVLKVARTLADLVGAAQITTPHLTEALAFREVASGTEAATTEARFDM